MLWLVSCSWPDGGVPPVRRSAWAASLAVAGLIAWLIAVASFAVTPAQAGEPGTPESDATESTTAPTSESTAAPTTEPTKTPDATETLTNAVLRWGVNHESNTAAYNPGTYNFLVAGKIPDPGKGGQTMSASQWKQRVGNVEVEKWSAVRKAWTDATWAGLSTDSAGAPLRVGTFSNHELVFSAGQGTLDRAAGTLRIAWQGSATVVFYSGASFFYLSDPVLEVANGKGTITATLSGFGSDQADQSQWSGVPDTEVTVATLSSVNLDDPDGFVLSPDYDGVRVDLAKGVAQIRSGVSWGAFPQSWVNFMEQVGTAAFWYSSGGAADPNKVAGPVTIAFDGRTALAPSPVVETSGPPEVTNSAPPPPASSGVAAPAPPVIAAPAVVPPPAGTRAAEDDAPLLSRPPTSVRLVSATTTASVTSAGRAWPWWGGGALLLLAAAALVIPVPTRGSH